MKGDEIKKVLSCIIVCLGGFSHGSMLSWPAEILPQLSSPKSRLGYINESMLSWIASVNFLGCMVGSILSSIIFKVTNEKVIITCTSLFTGISWIMVGLSTTPFMLCSSRILLGMGNAILMAAIPPYISSIAPPRLSGALSSMYALSLGLGLVYSVAAGKHMDWTVVSFVASIPPMILFMSAPFLKYSFEEAQQTLLGQPAQAPAERPAAVSVKHPGLLFIFLATMFMFSGVCPLSIFDEYLFMDQRTFSISNITLASNICQVIGGLIGAIAIDKFGRKPVLRAGGWVCLLSNILLSLYFSTVKESHKCPTAPGSFLCWTPAIATCLFFLGFGGGIGNVFFVLLGELVPAKKTGKIVPLVTFYLNFLQFAVIRSFLNVEYVIGLTNVFFLQAASNVFFLFGQGAWLPETRPETPARTGPVREYGAFRSRFDVDRYTTAESSGVDGSDCVLNHTRFFTKILMPQRRNTIDVS